MYFYCIVTFHYTPLISSCMTITLNWKVKNTSIQPYHSYISLNYEIPPASKINFPSLLLGPYISPLMIHLNWNKLNPSILNHFTIELRIPTVRRINLWTARMSLRISQNYQEVSSIHSTPTQLTRTFWWEEDIHLKWTAMLVLLPSSKNPTYKKFYHDCLLSF
jgi:hypothetical protein